MRLNCDITRSGPVIVKLQYSNVYIVYFFSKKINEEELQELFPEGMCV